MQTTNGADLPIGKRVILFVGSTEGGDMFQKGYYVYGQGMGEFVEQSNGKFRSKLFGDTTINQLSTQIPGISK